MFLSRMVHANKKSPVSRGRFEKLDGIQHNERCFEPELNSGLMNEEEKRREPDDSRT